MEQQERWWEHTPCRLIQTNMREIDMIDMDADAYVKEYPGHCAHGLFQGAP